MTCLEKPRRCYLVLALLSVIYFTPLWRHPTQLLYSKHSDVLWQHYPWKVFAVASWHEDGELPLWCPYACGGQPFQADGQSNLFYPPHAVFYAVPESWVAPLFGLLVWAHVLLAGCGMFAYARWRGLPPVGALVAAVGIMFAGKWLVHVLQAGHYIFIPAAWFPLLLLFLEQAVERRRLGYAAAAGVCLAMLLTGAHPQLVLYSLLLAGILSLRGVFTHYQKEHAVLMAGRVQESGNACGMRARFSNLMIQRQESVHGVPRLAKSPGPLRGLGWWLLAWGVAGSLAIGLAAVQL